jgi:hypothetical protein
MRNIPAIEVGVHGSSVSQVSAHSTEIVRGSRRQRRADRLARILSQETSRRRMRELLNIWIPCRHLNGNPHCRKCGPAFQEYLALARLERPRSGAR